jgi:cell wall-associated NlpC family hydrolase
MAFFAGGCISSSIRFTSRNRPAAPAHVRFVPSDWDYRKTYSVPHDKITQVAAGYLGIRYRFGGMSRKGVDCSGLVCMVYHDISRAKLPHSTRKLRALSRPVSLHEAKSGDLVFFRGGVFGAVNHVGIYLDGNKFIHAGTKKGVTYGYLDNAYFKERYVDVRRIFR